LVKLAAGLVRFGDRKFWPVTFLSLTVGHVTVIFDHSIKYFLYT